jgi:hypothetical protein
MDDEVDRVAAAGPPGLLAVGSDLDAVGAHLGGILTL